MTDTLLHRLVPVINSNSNACIGRLNIDAITGKTRSTSISSTHAPWIAYEDRLPPYFLKGVRA